MSRLLATLGSPISCKCPKPYAPAGVISKVASRVMVDGMPAATLGDMGLCGGPTVLLSSTSRLFIDGRPVHLVGDLNTCGGTTKGSTQSRCFGA